MKTVAGSTGTGCRHSHLNVGRSMRLAAMSVVVTAAGPTPDIHSAMVVATAATPVNHLWRR